MNGDGVDNAGSSSFSIEENGKEIPVGKEITVDQSSFSLEETEKCTNVQIVAPDDGDKYRWRTIYVMYVTAFFQSVNFSIVLSSLWPFMKKLNGNVTENFLGWTISCSCLVGLVSAVACGYWSDHRSSTEPLLFSLILMTVGNGLYAYAETFSGIGIWIIFGARLVLGLGSGVVSVCRAVVGNLSSSDERTKTISYLTTFQDLGFLIGPGFQAAMKPLGPKGYYISSLKLHFNIYTGPAFVMILFSLINVLLLFNCFNEYKKPRNKKGMKNESDSTESESHAPVDRIAIGVMLILWFVAMSIFTLTEVILSPVLMNYFAWSPENAVVYGGVMLSVSGVVGIGCYIFIAPLSRRFSERSILVVGFLLLLSTFILYLPWGPGYPKLTMAELKYGNGTIVHSSIADGGGCPYLYKWCRDTPRLPLPQFLVGVGIESIGIALACVLINILYSRIIGPFPQGKYMGWLSAIGSLSRIIGPIYAASLYAHFGMRWVAVGTIGILVSALLIFRVFWKHIVPYEKRFEP